MKTHSIKDLYREYQRRLDVRAVLEHYGAQNCSEHIGSDGTTEVVHSCLLDHIEPHHRTGDSHPSAWANIEKGLYCCAVYWSGSIFSLIQKLEGLEDANGVLEVVAPYLSGATRESESVRKTIQEAFSRLTAPPPMAAYSERVLDPWLKTHPYLREVRGISQETHELLKIGYDERENRIVFPVFFRQKLVGWQKRCVPPSDRWPGTEPDWPKYRNSSGLSKSELLYGHDLLEGSNQVVVVESPMSVAKAYSLSLPQLARIPVLATFGAKVSETQIQLLRDFSRVYVWFDADPAGHAGERKLVEGLYRHTSVFVVTPEEGRDLGDHTSGREAHEKIKDAVPAALWLRR